MRVSQRYHAIDAIVSEQETRLSPEISVFAGKPMPMVLVSVFVDLWLKLRAAGLKRFTMISLRTSDEMGACDWDKHAFQAGWNAHSRHMDSNEWGPPVTCEAAYEQYKKRVA